MTDIVHYALGYGFLGNLINRFIVSPRLDTIFDYRYKKPTRLFSGTASVGETKLNRHHRKLQRSAPNVIAIDFIIKSNLFGVMCEGQILNI